MRKAAILLVILAALCFAIGVVNTFWGRWALGIAALAKGPETFWRGATGLLLFAITLLMLQRDRLR